MTLKHFYTYLCVRVCVRMHIYEHGYTSRSQRAALLGLALSFHSVILGSASGHQAPLPPKPSLKWKSTLLRLTVNKPPGLRFWYQYHCLSFLRPLLAPFSTFFTVLTSFKTLYCCKKKEKVCEERQI